MGINLLPNYNRIVKCILNWIFWVIQTRISTLLVSSHQLSQTLTYWLILRQNKSQSQVLVLSHPPLWSLPQMATPNHFTRRAVATKAPSKIWILQTSNRKNRNSQLLRWPEILPSTFPRSANSSLQRAAPSDQVSAPRSVRSPPVPQAWYPRAKAAAQSGSISTVSTLSRSSAW